MTAQKQSPLLRRGKFLWMEPSAQKTYLQELKQRISEGYYHSDKIFSKIADDLAPILEEVALTK